MSNCHARYTEVATYKRRPFLQAPDPRAKSVIINYYLILLERSMA